MQTFNLEGKRRDSIGKVASNTSRTNGITPCILYGDGENIHFEVTTTSLTHLIYSPNVYKVNVKIDGADYECLMKEIQFHPVTDKVLHVDFLKLNEKKKVTTVVPIITEGLSIGVKNGGKLVQRVRKVVIKSFPKHLVDKVGVDVTNLEVGKTIRLGDLSINNVEILGSKNIPVATVLTPRALKAMAEAAAAADAANKAAAPTAAAPAADASKDKE